MKWSEDEGRRVPKEPQNPRQSLMTVIRDGQAEHYYLSKRIADAYQSQPFEATKIAEIWGKMMAPVRAILVSHNPVWMARNIPRDFMQTVKNIPEVKLRNTPRLANIYRKAAREAWREVMRGESSPDISEMARRRMLIPGRVYGAAEEHPENELERLATEFEIDTNAAEQAPEAHRTLATAWKAFLKDVGTGVDLRPTGELLNKLGRVSELTGKVAGFKFLTGHTTRSPQEVGHVVRNRVGTPDYRAKGEAQAITNNALIFSNVDTQGKRSAWESFKEDKAGYIWKTIATNWIPKILLAGAAAGLAGEYYRRVLQRIPEYDLANYAIIPLALSNGKAVYIRIPQDYEGQYFGSLFWKLSHARIMGKQGAVSATLQQVPWNPSSKLNPPLSVASDLFQYYGLGNNPTDEYRGQAVLTDQEMAAGGTVAAKQLAKHAWRTMGGTVLYDPARNQLIRSQSAPEQLLRSFPANILGTFLKITDQGVADRLRDVSGEVRQEKAGQVLDVQDRIQKSINAAVKEKGAPDRGDVRQLWGELRGEGKIPRDQTEKEFSNRYMRWAARVPANPYVEAFINAQSNQEKERLLMEYRKILSPAEYDEVLGEMMRARTQSPKSFRAVERSSERNEPTVQPGR
jgi:hypothetical protein